MEEGNRLSGSLSNGGEGGRKDGEESWTDERRGKVCSHALGVQQVKALIRRNIIVSDVAPQIDSTVACGRMPCRCMYKMVCVSLCPCLMCQGAHTLHVVLRGNFNVLPIIITAFVLQD